MAVSPTYGEAVTWQPVVPKIRPVRLLISWAILTASVYIAAGLTPGVGLDRPGAGALVALSLAFLNAIIPPALAALRLPFMVAIGFIGVLLVDAALPMLLARGFP